MQRYLVLIEKGENSYGAYAPDVPGCIAVGDTIEETLRLFQEALEFHLKGMAEDGETPPEPTHVQAHFIEIPAADMAPAQ